MDVTRRCDYACRIIRAAYRAQGRYRSISDISAEEDIPYAFARSIQHELVQAGFISTIRGARGGLRLNLDPKTTTVLDVLEALQGSVSVSDCAVDPDFCEKSPQCEYNQIWLRANDMLRSYFASVTLDDLFAESPQKLKEEEQPAEHARASSQA